jgi:predicted transcriptional regulator
MDEATLTQELLAFFKALADANRLKIIGLLANKPHTVEQLAANLNLGASTVSHHLSRLSDAGLVSARAEGYYSVYQLESANLDALAKRLLERQTLQSFSADVDADAFDRKVLREFLLPDGRIKAFPAQEKKFIVILRHALKKFQPGVRYTEKEVSETLSQLHEDFASLRRGFIDYKFMARKDGVYWVLEELVDQRIGN